MVASETCKHCALTLIEKYYGGTTAKLYDTYYNRRDEKAVKESVRELLTEMVGSAKAEQEMDIFDSL
jgi:hypothetical protein